MADISEEMKEKSLVSLQRSLGESLIELEKRERELEERFEQLVLRQKELDSIQNSTDSGVKEKTNTLCSRVKIEQSENDHNVATLPYSASYQLCTTNGHLLQVLLTEHLKKHNTYCNELFTVLQRSPDPAKLVLDAVRGFYPSHSSGGQDAVFDLSAVRSSCIFLLEKLMVISPEISPQVREEAKKLASDWKAKMDARIESHLEVSGFLQLLTSYRLHADFSGDEIRRFIEIDQKIRQASSFEPPLCLADEAPVNTDQAENLTGVIPSSPNLIGNDLTQDDILNALQQPDPAKHVLGMVKESFSRIWKRGGHVGSAVCFLKSYIFIFEQLLRSTSEIKIDVREDAMELAKEWEVRMRGNNIENCLEALGFLLFVAAYNFVSSFIVDDLTSFLEIISRDRLILQQSQNLALAYRIDVFLQNLIGQKKHVVAVSLACAFKLTDKFSPAKLLTEYIEEAKICSRQLCQEKKSVEEKDKATDLEIAALEAVTRCVKDHNLESEFPLDNVTKRVALLEKIKMDRLHSAVFFGGTDEPQQQQQMSNKRKTSDISSTDEQQQSKKKFPRKLCFG